ncbi:MAG: hypothetical protein PHS66_06925 [Candidatus Omnitrophica bacterium]|nr:hypothetical protein [Candidatus Omnitrophota bacterium]
MNDAVRLAISIILIAIVAFLGFPSLVRVFSNIFKISLLEAVSIVTLLSNFIMIAIMIVTIFVSNQSSLEQINSIKNSTQVYINKTEEFNTMTKDALMSALLLEYKDNLRQAQEIVDSENLYIQQTSDSFPFNVFSHEAYQANLNNATFNDPVLLEKIVQAYAAFKLFQNFLDSSKLPQMTKEYRRSNIAKLIKMIKENLTVFLAIEQEIISYRKLRLGIDKH